MSQSATLVRDETPMLNEQHEFLTTQVASSNYKKLDVESVFSQHTAVSKRQYQRAGLDQGTSGAYTQTFEEEAVTDNTPADAGVIERIVLQNFMCHDYFELNLGPQLNFIIGRNGSGKSAILTSLSVGLGCKATETDRGKNLKDLIKRGTNSAKITITFKNKGQYAFEHELYGDKIIVERMLRIDGVSGYSLRSENNKPISSKKGDLDTMLDYFGITINNPLAFLSQGAAKTFLTCSTDEDKYSFFMKGIQMEQTINEFMHSNDQLSKIHQEIDLKSKNIQALKEDAKKAKQVYLKFHESKNLRVNKKYLSGKLIWLQIVSKESDIKTLKQKSEQLRQQVESAAAQIQEQRQTLTELDVEINQIIEGLTGRRAELDDINDQKRERKQEVLDFGKKIQSLQGRVEDSTKDNQKKKTRILKLNRNIEAEIKKLNSLNGGSKESIIGEIEELKISVKQKVPEQQECVNKKSEVEQESRGLYKEYKPRIEDKRQEIRDLYHLRDNLSKSEKDKLTPYGDNMKKILEFIETDRGFRQKPIGPLGLYMSLKPGFEKYQDLLEKVFNNQLDAFVVQNYQDHKRLVSVLRQHRLGNQVVMRKFERFRYGEQLREKHGLTRIIDALKFDNEDVKYTMIDIASIESSVLEDDPSKAAKLVQNIGSIKHAYSLFDNGSGKRFSVNAFTGNFRSDPVFYFETKLPRLRTSNKVQSTQMEIAKIDLKIDEKKIEGQQLQNEFDSQIKEKQKKIKQYQQQYDQLRKEIAMVNRKISHLESKLDQDQDSTNLDSFMDEKASLEREIVINDNIISSTNMELQELNSEFEKLKVNYEQVQENIKLMERAIRQEEHKIEKINDRKTRICDSIENQQSVQRKKQNIVNTIEEKIPMMEEQIVREIPNAEKWCSREEAKIDLRHDSTEDIKRQIQIINQQLSEVNKTIGKTEEQVIEEHTKKSGIYKTAREELLKAHELRDKLTKSIYNRMTASKSVREMLCQAADNDFSTSLHQRGFEGKLLFDFKNKKLQMLVGKDGNAPREVTSLSGGEKSYTQIALLLAIWKPMRSKIRGLDEFDVFMDNINRKISMRLMLENLRKEPQSQTIFITPQDIGHVKGIDASDVCIHKLRDPARKNNSTNN